MTVVPMPVQARNLCARLALIAVTASFVTLAPARDASAHAVLQHTEPLQNASVIAAPDRVDLKFNEPVEASFGAVRVYDRRGSRVDRDQVSSPGGDSSSIAIGLRDGLPRGTYTTTYRVVSADGHPVSGGFSFAVGEQVALARGTPDVADLLARTSAGPVVEGVYGAGRGLHYAALLLLVGAIFFRMLVWPAATERRWPRRLLLGGALLGMVAATVNVALQGAIGAGVSLGGAFGADIIRGSLETRNGEAWAVRALAWVVVVGLCLLPGRPSRRRMALLTLPIAVIVASLPLSGHADTQSPQAVLIPSDLVHVLAGGAWLGGLIMLLTAFWPGRGQDLAEGSAHATARFSRIALPAIAALVLAGTVQAWFYLDSVGAFFTSTYGWALLAKIGLVAGVVALGSISRRHTAGLSGALPQTPMTLRRAMRAEVVLALFVLAGTATLVRAAPPAAVNAGPVIRELNLGALRLQMDIEPGTVGPNDYHLYLFDRKTGAQIDRVEEMTVRVTQPDEGIGPITIPIPREGPAHYELRGSALSATGTWTAEVVARVSEFEELTATTEFKVRKG